MDRRLENNSVYFNGIRLLTKMYTYKASVIKHKSKSSGNSSIQANITNILRQNYSDKIIIHVVLSIPSVIMQ